MNHYCSTERTARKAHRCYVCRWPIEPGTRYHDQRCIEDGSASTFRVHLACHALGCKAMDLVEDGYDGELVRDFIADLTEAQVLELLGDLDAAERDRTVAWWRMVREEVACA